MTERLPQEGIGDKLHYLAQAGLSAVPCIGGSAAVLFNMFVGMPIQRRWRSFLEDLANRITKLEQEGQMNVEDLSNNDEFVSTVMQASQVAVRNHQQEKIDALRNVVLNTALGQAPEDWKREMFLGFVDDLTVLHLRVLKALHDNDDAGIQAERPELLVTQIAELAERLLPDLLGQKDICVLLVDDLCRRALLFWNREGGVVVNMPRKQVADLGREFLAFISEPRDEGV